MPATMRGLVKKDEKDIILTFKNSSFRVWHINKQYKIVLKEQNGKMEVAGALTLLGEGFWRRCLSWAWS